MAKNKNDKTNITLEEYKALCHEASDRLIEFQFKVIDELIPRSHHTNGTINYIMLSFVTKFICSICENDMEARKKVCTTFCEALPKLVRDAIVLENKTISKKKH